MAFTFTTAGKIIFGAGSVDQVPALAKKYGYRVLLVTGSNPGRAADLLQGLKSKRLRVDRFQIGSEPDVELVTAGAELAREKACDLVIGFGGGSVVDGAKAIAALLTNQSPIHEYLEVIGNGRPLENPPAPCIAIPTTAGTGSEVTRNAVIRSKAHRVKVSMRHPDMLPDIAVVDPQLTLNLPSAVTAATGFDALCQLLEAYVSTKANPLTDGLCREGLIRCSRALVTAVEDGQNLTARTDMSLASLFSGLALANAGLGAVHGIAGPLGGMYSAPHGAVCARLLPVVTTVNIEALNHHDPESPALQRYAEIARILTSDPQATIQEGLAWLQSTADALAIPSLDQWGLQHNEVPSLAKQALKASSMQANPIALGRAELEAAIILALEGDP